MQIRTHDEVDPFEVHKLNLASFGWAVAESRMRRQAQTDPRVMEGFARYAVERGRLLAQVIPLKMPVRLTSGVEARTRFGFSNIGPMSADADLRRFRMLGYAIVGPTPWKVMAVPLVEGLPARELPRLFGGPQGRFLLYPTDSI